MTDVRKEEIYRDFYGKVYGYILSRINKETDAEDIAADVFLKVYEKLDTFDENKASLSTWIYTVTRNTLTDWYRTKKTFAEIPETLADNSSVEDEICTSLMLETLADALEALEERERDIVILHYYSGKTLKEIAGRLGISYAYVKVLKNKSLVKLKEYFENQ